MSGRPGPPLLADRDGEKGCDPITPMFETPRPPYVIAGNAAGESVVGAAVHVERSCLSAVETHRRQRSATLLQFSAVLSSVTLICGALLFQ